VSRMETVLLPIGPDLYGVPIQWVREVLAAPAVARLATAPPLVLGLINLRGEIVPLLDTAALLGVGSVDHVAFATVLHTAHGPAAFAATDLPIRAELTTPVGPSELPGTAGTYQVDGRLVVLLDPGALLRPERLSGHETVAPTVVEAS
jgi:hypothetical protein